MTNNNNDNNYNTYDITEFPEFYNDSELYKSFIDNGINIIVPYKPLTKIRSPEDFILCIDNFNYWGFNNSEKFYRFIVENINKDNTNIIFSNEDAYSIRRKYEDIGIGTKELNRFITDILMCMSICRYKLYNTSISDDALTVVIKLISFLCLDFDTIMFNNIIDYADLPEYYFHNIIFIILLIVY